MTETLNHLFDRLRGYSIWEVLVELWIIWIVVYLIIGFLKGTRGAGMIKGLAFLLFVGTLAVQILGGEGGQNFQRLTYLYERSLAFLAIAFLVIFQPELRRALIRVGDTVFSGRRRRNVTPTIDSIVDACEFLARNRIGALLAIERSIGIGGTTDGGTRINADLSARLLQSIFWPNSALHDLGVVIREDKIIAANVQFPMAEHGDLDQEYGSRHRAGVGITQDSDCLTIIVSEERGEIRTAEWGRLSSAITPDELRTLLFKRLAEPVSKTEQLRRTKLQEASRQDPLAEEDEIANPFDDPLGNVDEVASGDEQSSEDSSSSTKQSEPAA